jgi:hypothetical protein
MFRYLNINIYIDYTIFTFILNILYLIEFKCYVMIFWYLNVNLYIDYTNVTIYACIYGIN